MRFSSLWLAAAALLFLGSCLKIIRPGKDFSHYTPPPAPDYAQAASWAALPERADAADVVPPGSGFRDQQATAPADVFFLHPTTYFWRKRWNASLANNSVNEFTDDIIMRGQAAAFNNVARVYAPRYRQATLYSFFEEETTSGQQALDLAYTDVKAAFQYYLDHYNQGRPLIIAGHSQGTVHATRLLHEFFDNNPQRRRQLVAAYLIGFKVKSDEYQTLRPCADSTQTGCYITWNAVAWGSTDRYEPFANGLATNPLTWTFDTLAAPARLNRGGVPLDYKRFDTQVTDAKIFDGFLWVHPPEPGGYPRFLLPGQPKLRQSYHRADYGLFYGNIRHNAATRVRAWRGQTK